MEGTQLLALIADDIREGANPTNATADVLRATDRPNTRLLDDVRHMDQLNGRVGDVAAQNALESLGEDASVTDVIDMLTFETYRWLAIELSDDMDENELIEAAEAQATMMYQDSLDDDHIPVAVANALDVTPLGDTSRDVARPIAREAIESKLSELRSDQ